MLKSMRNWSSFWKVIRAWRTACSPLVRDGWRRLLRRPTRSRRPSTRRQRGLFSLKSLRRVSSFGPEMCEPRQMLTGVAAIVVPPYNTTPSSSGDEAVQIDLAASLTGFSSSLFTYAWSVTKDSVPYDSGSSDTFSFTPDDNGEYHVYLTVDGDLSETDDDDYVVTINNVAPTANAAGPYTVAEGGQIELIGTGADPAAADTLATTWDLDGDTDFGDELNVNWTSAPEGVDNVEIMIWGNPYTWVWNQGLGGYVVDGISYLKVHDGIWRYGLISGFPSGAWNTGLPGNHHPFYTDTPFWEAAWGEFGNPSWNDFGEGFVAGAAPADSYFDATELDGPTNVTVTLRVTDDDGGSSTSTALVVVTNAAPTVDAQGPYTVMEGASVALSGTFSDPGEPDTHTFAWDLDGDGTFGETSTARGTETSLNPTFNAAGLAGSSTVTVTLRVTDDDGASTTNTATIEVTALPTANAGGPYTVAEGAVLSLSPSGTGSGDLSYTWDLDGDTDFGDELNVNWTSAPEGVDNVEIMIWGNPYTWVWDQGLGGYVVDGISYLKVHDGIWRYGLISGFPSGAWNTGLPGNHHPFYTDTPFWEAAWGEFGNPSWNDFGTGFVSGAAPMDAYFDASELDGPSQATITVRVTDDGTGASATNTTVITVTNVAPTANAQGPYYVLEGATAPLSGTFSDPGVPDTHTIAWDLDGDGTFGESTTARGAETGLNPTFNAAGLTGPSTVTVTLRVTDDDGGSTTSTAVVEICDTPTANAGAPYTVGEGSLIELSPSGTGIGDLTYAWDLDGDGDFGDELNVNWTSAPEGVDNVEIMLLGNPYTWVWNQGLGGYVVDGISYLKVYNGIWHYGLISGFPSGAWNTGLPGNHHPFYTDTPFWENAWGEFGNPSWNDFGTGFVSGAAPMDGYFDASELDGPTQATITVRVTDGIGATATATTVVSVTNVAPTANAGDPYTVNEGSTVLLAGTGGDPCPSDTLTFEWDLDGDGTFGETGGAGAYGDETGAAPIFNAASLTGPSVVTVTLRVSDDDGGFDTSEAEIHILDI